MLGMLMMSSLAGAVSFGGCLDDCTGMQLSWGSTELCPMAAEHPLGEPQFTQAGLELPFDEGITTTFGGHSLELPPGCIVVKEVRYTPSALVPPESEQEPYGITAAPVSGNAAMLKISLPVQPEDDKGLVRNMTRDFLGRATDLPEHEVGEVVEHFTDGLRSAKENERPAYPEVRKRTTLNMSLHNAPDVSLEFQGGPTSESIEGAEWVFSLWAVNWDIRLEDGWTIQVLPTGAWVEIPGLRLSTDRTIEELRERLIDHDLPAPAAKDVEVYCSM